MAEAFWSSFSRSISNLTEWRVADKEKPEKLLPCPFEIVLRDPRSSDSSKPWFAIRLFKYTASSKAEPYIDGEKCTWSDDNWKRTWKEMQENGRRRFQYGKMIQGEKRISKNIKQSYDKMKLKKKKEN